MPDKLMEKDHQTVCEHFSIETDVMKMGHKYHSVHFMRLFYEGSILLFYLLGMVMTVVLGAYGLELFLS